MKYLIVSCLTFIEMVPINFCSYNVEFGPELDETMPIAMNNVDRASRPTDYEMNSFLPKRRSAFQTRYRFLITPWRKFVITSL